MAILDELYIHVGEAHQYYKFFLKGGYLDGKSKYYTCNHWHPSIDYIDIEVSVMHANYWLFVCQDCYHFSWEALEILL